MNKEILCKHYIEEDMSMKEISLVFGVHEDTVSRKLKKFNIKKSIRQIKLKAWNTKGNRVSNQTIHASALKYKTKAEFQRNDCSKYILARNRGILDKVCSHMKLQRKKWTNEDLAAEAKKYKTRAEFQRKSRIAESVARKRHILDEICSHMNFCHKKWTNKNLAKEAKKYKTRKELQIKNCSAYQAAQKRGILDHICSHMKALSIQWDREKVMKEAKKYKTRIEFQRLNRKAYRAAHSLDIKEAFAHMERPGDVSFFEKELLEKLKQKYPSARKKISSKIKFKEYKIKRMDIDIFIPELKKGIEFDGDYWHGDGFKRKWTKCPKTYHKVKDEYFLSKGIKILHIKEKDWIKDKDKCLNKIQLFLKGKDI